MHLYKLHLLETRFNLFATSARKPGTLQTHCNRKTAVGLILYRGSSFSGTRITVIFGKKPNPFLSEFRDEPFFLML
jgi:hypothetical protein